MPIDYAARQIASQPTQGAELNASIVQYHEAAVDPTITDDETQAFQSGHKWVNTTNGARFDCTDNTAGAAVWKPILTLNLTRSLNQAMGADIASATTLALPTDGNMADVTGTTATTDFSTTAAAGAFGPWYLRATGAWPITHGAGVVEVVGGASLTLAAGDVVMVWQDGAVFRVVQLNGGGGGDPLALTTLESKAAATPTVFEDNAAREIGQLCTGWCRWTGITTSVIADSFNVSSITDNGTGDTSVNWANTFANANYCTVFGCSSQSTAWSYTLQNYPGVPPTTTVLRVLCTAVQQSALGASDVANNSVAVFGGL